MRRAMVVVLTGAAVLAGGCGSNGEQAGPEPAPVGEQPADVVAAAEQRLGVSFAGGFVGPDGDVVVLITDAAETEQVRALGAEPRVVQYGKAELDDWHDRVSAALGPQPPAAVTTWGVDVRRNAVVVSVLPEQPVPPELQQVVDEAAGAVVLDEAPGPVRPLPGS